MFRITLRDQNLGDRQRAALSRTIRHGRGISSPGWLAWPGDWQAAAQDWPGRSTRSAPYTGAHALDVIASAPAATRPVC